jgi:hypothetical protein
MEPDDRLTLPPKVYSEVVVSSLSGESLLEGTSLVTSENVNRFYADPDRTQATVDRLQSAGFEVLDVGNLSISIAATPEVYEQSFRGSLEVVERPVLKELGRQATAAFINAIDESPFGQISPQHSIFQNLVAGIVINEPLYYFQSDPSRLCHAPSPQAIAPQTQQSYISVPEELATHLNATAAHQQGYTGKGVHVVMVDSGWYRHPFFQARKYQVEVKLAPGSSDIAEDCSGHGTGESANLLAIAPDVRLTVVKADIAISHKTRNVNSIAALRTAAALKPDIISCSWGSDQRSPIFSPYNRLLAATVADIVHQNIIMVFAAGNGQWGFPAQHPEVIAAGGSYLHLNGSLRGTLEASNYASSFLSPIYAGRSVPDVCGLVGQLPRGQYILLPVPPGCGIDSHLAIQPDGTEAGDGWAAFSGTSAAAPQVAGICALLRQLHPQLSPTDAKAILQQTARDVLGGSSNPSSSGVAASAGPDLATGHGLIDAHAAVKALLAQLLPSPRPSPLDRVSPQPSAFLAESLPLKTTLEIDPMTAYPKLNEKLDQILMKFDEILDEKIRTGEIEAVELNISLANFVPRSVQSKAVWSLVKVLQGIVDTKDGAMVLKKDGATGSKSEASASSGQSKGKTNILKRHVFAAKSLLQVAKHHDLALFVLNAAIDSENQEVAECAIEALGKIGSNAPSDLSFIEDEKSLFFTETIADIPGLGKVRVTIVDDSDPNEVIISCAGKRFACTQYDNGVWKNCSRER